jgi:hypothetical protein
MFRVLKNHLQEVNKVTESGVRRMILAYNYTDSVEAMYNIYSAGYYNIQSVLAR